MNENLTHQLTVGDRAHRIVAEVLKTGRPQVRSEAAILLTRCGRQVFKEHPVDYRSRASFLDAVTAAGVYLQRFHPGAGWELTGTEIVVGQSRFDLVYGSTSGPIVIDELKLGVGRAGESAVRAQIDRYVDAGRRLWGSNFIGVRLCAVHEPLQSRLYLPDRHESMLLAELDLADGLEIR